MKLRRAFDEVKGWVNVLAPYIAPLIIIYFKSQWHYGSATDRIYNAIAI